MPLLRRKTVPLEPIPVQDSENKIKDVWQVRFTGEIFTDYIKYAEKIMLYKKPIWTCELTGKMNLTYEEALESERNCREKTKNSYPEVWIPLTLEMAQYKQGKLNDIVDNIYDHLKDKYINGEILYFTIPNTQQQKLGKLVAISNNEENNEKKYRVHMISKYGKELKEGDLGNKPVEYDVDFDSLRRDRCIYSKQLMRNFLRESTTRDSWLGAPIVVKHSLAEKYNISEEPPSELKELIEEKSKKRKRNSEVVDVDEEESDDEGEGDKKSKKKSKKNKEDGESDSDNKKNKKVKEEEVKEDVNIKYPIEDLELPKYIKEDKSLEIPKPSSDFGSISQKQVSSALMVWDFLCVYGKPLNLFPFTFDSFEQSLSYTEGKQINFLIKEIYCSLLILILNNYKTLNNNNYANFNRSINTTELQAVDNKYSLITMQTLKKLIKHDKVNEVMVIDEEIEENQNMSIENDIGKNKNDNKNQLQLSQGEDDGDKTIVQSEPENENEVDSKNIHNDVIEEDNENDGDHEGDGDEEEDNVSVDMIIDDNYQIQTNDPYIWEIFPHHYAKILSIFEKYPVDFGPWFKWKTKPIQKKRSGRSYNLNIENIQELEDRIKGWEVVLLSCLIEYGCPSKIPEFESIIAKLCCIDENNSNHNNNIPLQELIKSGFLTLTADEKIIILRFLIDELAINCVAIRDFIDHSFEILTELRKQKIELSRERKEIIRLKHELNKDPNETPKDVTNNDVQIVENKTEDSVSVISTSTTKENEEDFSIGHKKMSNISYESDSYSINGGNTSDNGEYDSSAPPPFNPSRATLRQKMMMQKKLEKEEKERKRREEFNHYREEALDHIRQNRKRNAEKRKIEDRERNLERKQQVIDSRWKGWSAMIRLKMLGRDRYYNRYWWYDSSWLGSNNNAVDRTNNKGFGANSSNVIPSWGTGKLFVENVHFDKKKKNVIELEDDKFVGTDSEWSYYSTPAELDVLLEWLNPKGIRESQLLKNIMKVLNDMAGIMVKREQDLTNMLIKSENLENKRTTRSGTNNYQNQLASCYLGYYNRWMEI